LEGIPAHGSGQHGCGAGDSNGFARRFDGSVRESVLIGLSASFGLSAIGRAKAANRWLQRHCLLKLWRQGKKERGNCDCMLPGSKPWIAGICLESTALNALLPRAISVLSGPLLIHFLEHLIQTQRPYTSRYLIDLCQGTCRKDSSLRPCLQPSGVLCQRNS
jgi:hypothetical protein